MHLVFETLAHALYHRGHHYLALPPEPFSSSIQHLNSSQNPLKLLPSNFQLLKFRGARVVEWTSLTASLKVMDDISKCS